MKPTIYTRDGNIVSDNIYNYMIMAYGIIILPEIFIDNTNVTVKYVTDTGDEEMILAVEYVELLPNEEPPVYVEPEYSYVPEDDTPQVEYIRTEFPPPEDTTTIGDPDNVPDAQAPPTIPYTDNSAVTVGTPFNTVVSANPPVEGTIIVANDPEALEYDTDGNLITPPIAPPPAVEDTTPTTNIPDTSTPVG
jgi:hypothetical protein